MDPHASAREAGAFFLSLSSDRRPPPLSALPHLAIVSDPDSPRAAPAIVDACPPKEKPNTLAGIRRRTRQACAQRAADDLQQRYAAARRRGDDVGASQIATALEAHHGRQAAGQEQHAAAEWRAADWRSIALVADGVTLSNAARIGLGVAEDGSAADVERERAIDWLELRECVPVEWRADVDAVVRLYWSATRRAGFTDKRRWIPAPIARHFRRYVAALLGDRVVNVDKPGAKPYPDACTDRTAWRSAALWAVRADAVELGEKQRDQCGRATFEARRADGSAVVWKMRCEGHRCRHCSKVAGSKQRARILAQLAHDTGAEIVDDKTRPPTRYPAGPDLNAGEAGGGWPIFGTVGWSPLELAKLHDVYDDAAKILTSRLAQRHLQQLARNLRADGAAVDYFAALELHRSGSCHVHLLIRSPELLAAMQREAAGFTGDHHGPLQHPAELGRELEEYRRKIDRWSRAKKRGERKRKPRSPVGQTAIGLRAATVAAGFGAVCWYAPAISLGAIADYCSKDTYSKPPIAVAGEVTKARQAGELVDQGDDVERVEPPPVLPRGTHRFRRSRGWQTTRPPAREPDGAGPIVSLLIHKTPIDDVLAYARAIGFRVGGVVDAVDMTGPARKKNERWPRERVSAIVLGTGNTGIRGSPDCGPFKRRV